MTLVPIGGNATINILTGTDLTLSFGKSRALNGVTVEVKEGEVLAVTGSSGSGKSTLLHCLATILEPAGGEVVLAGRRIDRLSEKERSRVRRSEYGFVFQFGELVEELSLVENVSLPLRLKGMSRKRAMRNAFEALRDLGIDEPAARLPSEVSGGQAQRAAVARALIHRPKVVFADEPTGALDAANGTLVLNTLLDAARTQGIAVVLVTHEARVAAQADRILQLADGRVIESPTINSRS